MVLLAGFERPKIVASLSRDLLENGEQARRLGADLLEVRIDLLPSLKDLEVVLEELNSRLPVIVTNRCRREGGNWKGGEDERVELLLQCLPFASGVDVELTSPSRDRVVAEAKKLGRTVIISYHDFEKTPHDLKGILRREIKAGADIAKLAVTPLSLGDVLDLLEVTLSLSREGRVCTIAMGELGRHSRVMLPVFGSCLTYGSVVDTGTAPGQLSVGELKYMLELLLPGGRIGR